MGVSSQPTRRGDPRVRVMFARELVLTVVMGGSAVAIMLVLVVLLGWLSR